MVWTTLQKFSSIFIGFISGIVLARLLTPDDYGCIGMLTIFMVLSETLIDAGFGSALIQKKNPTQTDYSTIFWWNLLASIVLYALLFFGAPLVAQFYHIPLLCSVLRVQGLILIIYALNLIQRNQLRKKLNFKLLSTITIATSVFAFGITIVLALMGLGVWALVVQHMLLALIPTLVFWLYVKWRPKFVFSWSSFKELFSFGFFMFLIHLMNQFSKQIEGLLIGRWYNPATLGYYTKAAETEKIASTTISNVLTQVTYPLFASVQDNKERLIAILKRITVTLAYFTTPLMMLLCLCAKPLFIILYSEKWVTSVPYFQLLCIAGIAYSLQAVNNQTVAALGKSKVMFIWTVVKRCISLALKVGGLVFWGIKGLLVGVVISTWFAYFVNITVVSKYVGYRNTQQILDLLPIFLITGIAYVVSYYVGGQFQLNLYVDAIVKTGIFVTIYLGWSLIFKPETYIFCKDLIKSKVNKHGK